VYKRQEVWLEYKEHCHFFKNKTGLKQGDPLSPILFNLALQKVIQCMKMVPSGIRIGKEQLNILAYAYDIALIAKNEIEIRKLFVEMENSTRATFLIKFNFQDRMILYAIYSSGI
jgi:hypothetical protein